MILIREVIYNVDNVEELDEVSVNLFWTWQVSHFALLYPL